ncbi:hypothetical protein O0544_14855 [Edwardsiella anguillarum]|nr:hypothetical protein [Edwardsiella anguillarum]
MTMAAPVPCAPPVTSATLSRKRVGLIDAPQWEMSGPASRRRRWAPYRGIAPAVVLRAPTIAAAARLCRECSGRVGAHRHRRCAGLHIACAMGAI